MTEREDIVTALVAAAGGQLIGRVRLQKAVYLLQRLGCETGFNFEYYHYGPYSRELDNATADAKALGLIREVVDHRLSDGAMYSIFKLGETDWAKNVFPGMDKDRVSKLVRRFAETNVTVLELAATVDWLWRSEEFSDWRAEITRRKGRKVQSGRLDKAVELLSEFGLPPPANQR